MNLPPEAVEIVNLKKCEPPDDYHCHCPFCQKFRGMLVRPDGSFYSKTVRRKYYTAEESNMESSHIAKTPVHLARWAVQQFTKPGDWVLDPTIGAGTTGVEALTHGRKAIGVELEFGRMARNNMKAHGTEEKDFKLFEGDARDLKKFMNGWEPFVSLIVNNPPYSGDEHGAPIKNKNGVKVGRYQKNYDRMLTNNIAFLKEGEEYFRTIALSYLKPGGRFVIGVKDMMRQREHYPLHQHLGEALLTAIPQAEFVGTVILPHWPRTLGISAYSKRYGITPALYQTLLVFRKREEDQQVLEMLS